MFPDVRWLATFTSTLRELKLCFYSLWLLVSNCAVAAAAVVGVQSLNLHSALYCLRKGEGVGKQRQWVSCWSVALNPEWHLCLDAGANIGFGPGHTLGRWVNGPLCQAHRAARALHSPTCCLSTPLLSAEVVDRGCMVRKAVLCLPVCDQLTYGVN